MKPIDLSAYANRTVDFIINGDLIKCPELSYKDLKRINAYEANAKSTQEEEMEIILWLLNRNTSGKKFTRKDVEELPAGAVGRIYSENVLLTRKALTDPN